MNKSTALLAAVMLCLGIAAYAADDAKPAAEPAAAAPAAAQADQKDPQTTEAKFSYMIGYQFGKNQNQMPVKFDKAAFLMGIEEGQQEKPCRVTPEQQKALQMEITEKSKADAAAAGEKNKKEGDDYLAENGKKKGVITTKSGLQYTVTKEGTGATPKDKDRVRVNYTGTFIDGKKFDSSADHPEQPSIFPVGGLVPGFNEALKLMKVGGSYNLVIPGDQAYGAQPPSAEIGPNRTLLFQVDLLEIMPPEAAGAGSPLDMGGMPDMDKPAPKKSAK